ncbi:PTH1 family peptidyl-tRNA hydrolase [Virgibacillus natechei]|uniref:Peptidyl-tRNA hydrolase n=1 Tax=Virgibacillus natechei TaxID=1216297 RepID=A0ABS4IJ32_9BACI|nr:aminoacyl-tRNA hydrolase [Virgibacillus natechei]MBP1970356.1 PTH1 family peptidyl-tRNA hydrolase [Virgibacillus natechei]UZD13183.1 aminoacyl-tRNA hydrolase [Virgibacillus natechei]
MKCIVGLGNPGKKYKDTRHNVGFMVIEELLNRHQWDLNKKKFNGKYAMEHLQGEKVLLLQPHTYMNLSGQSIRPLMDYYNMDVDDVLVMYDDLDLPPGKIRLRQKGGHGGHNGIRSSIDHLGTKEFKRLRIGIGRPTTSIPVVDYVLGSFTKEQQEDVEHSIKVAADACEYWLQNPFLEVMNEYNS